jgi:hypothetical protein
VTPADEKRVRAIVREEHRRLLLQMAALLGGDPSGYSSRKGHGPPGYSAEKWKSIARQIGVKRGRWHYVTADALARHESGQSNIPPPPSLEPWDPLQNIEDARLRRSRRGGRVKRG